MTMRRKDREVSYIDGIEEILRQCKTCHVAMVDEGAPYIVPLSFGYSIINGKVLELFFHSAPEGRKLDILKRSNKVCFEMSYEGELIHSETPCNSGYYYASVIGSGTAVFIDDPDEKCRALSIIFKHQSGNDMLFTAGQAEGVCVFKIVSADFTGKKKPRPDTKSENSSVRLATIIVKSMEESKEFYSAVMGFHIDSEYDLGAMGRITLMGGGGDAMVELIESPAYPVGFWSVGVYVDDMEDAMEGYRAKGARILAEPAPITGGSCAFIEDPNGVRFAIVCKRIKNGA